MAGRNEFPRLPGYSLHRSRLTAADSSNSTNVGDGVDSYPFRDAILHVNLVSGTLSSLALEILYWNSATGAFVSSNPAQTFTGITGSVSIAITPMGRRFFVKATTLTGTNPVVDIHTSNPNVQA